MKKNRPAEEIPQRPPGPAGAKFVTCARPEGQTHIWFDKRTRYNRATGIWAPPDVVLPREVTDEEFDVLLAEYAAGRREFTGF